MLRLCSLAGEELVVLRPQEFEGKTVRSLKTLVAKQIGISRFRQRWLSEDHIELKEEDFASASDVQLLVLEFVQAEDVDVLKLFDACNANDVEQVDELLRKPLNPNVKDLDNEAKTALHMTARSGHVECLALLLEAGVVIGALDFCGMDALHLGAMFDKSEAVQLLLEANAERDAMDSDGRTALHWAADLGHLNVVQLLLEAGADKDAADSEDMSAMDLAAGNQHVEVVKLLKAEVEQK